MRSYVASREKKLIFIRLDQIFDFLVKGIKCILPAFNNDVGIDRREHKESLDRYLKAWSGFDKGVCGWLDAVEAEGEMTKEERILRLSRWLRRNGAKRNYGTVYAPGRKREAELQE